MRALPQGAGVAAVGLLVAGLGVLLWPLRAPGVTGTAVRPHYPPFSVGVSSYSPLPDHPTPAQLHRLGIRLPPDRVERRRRIGAGLVGAGLVLGVGGAWVVRRPSA